MSTDHELIEVEAAMDGAYQRRMTREPTTAVDQEEEEEEEVKDRTTWPSWKLPRYLYQKKRKTDEELAILSSPLHEFYQVRIRYGAL